MMYAWNEIQNMTPEELAAAQEKMYKKIFLKYVVVPFAIYVTLDFVARRFERRSQ